MQRFFALLLVLLLGASACSASTTTTATDDDASSQAAEAATDESTANQSTADDAAEEPTSAPPTPEPTATTEPAMTDDDAANGSVDADAEATELVEQSPFGDDLSPSEIACVVKGLAEEPDLLANAIAGTDFDSLDLDDQVDTALIALDCAPETAAAQFTEGFTNDIATAQPELGNELGGCLVNQLGADNPDRRNVLLGFAALGEELPVPPEAEGALVDSLAECAPGPVFAEWLIAEFADDPQMASSIDADCIRTAFPDDTIRSFWGAMITQGGEMDDLDDTATAPLMNALFSCMSMGQMMADQAALDGVELSDETVSCIDTEMAGEDLAAMMSGEDAAGEARFTQILIGCLSPEELAQLGG